MKPLATFEGAVRDEVHYGILFSLKDYLTLVDMTGRMIREGKHGVISMHQPPILERLEIANKSWLENATQFEALYRKKFARKRRQKNAA